MISEQISVDDDGASHLAQRIDQHLADRAYAMESLIAYTQKNFPQLLTGPRVLVGMSAGGIALPTVASRIGAVDAAVVIGGGEDIGHIIACSPLFGSHIQLVDVEYKLDRVNLTTNCVPCVDAKRRNEFANAVLQKTKLDPHFTATALRGTPLLMVQAMHDQIVPAETGHSLYESLGRPERWRYRTGHIGLSLLVPWKANYILDWMSTHAAAEIKLARANGRRR